MTDDRAGDDGSTVECPQCGSANPIEANFCSVCGGPLERSPEHTAAHPVLVVDTDDQPLLVVIRGSNTGSRFALDQEVTTVGRDTDSTVLLDDVTVSRHHAEVRSTDEGFVVRDVGSLNGTYVNGDRVEEHLLAEGDQLQVGRYRLVYAFGARDGDG